MSEINIYIGGRMNGKTVKCRQEQYAARLDRFGNTVIAKDDVEHFGLETLEQILSDKLNKKVKIRKCTPRDNELTILGTKVGPSRDKPFYIAEVQ